MYPALVLFYHQWHEVGIGPASGWDLNPGWHVWLNFGTLWHQAPIFSCAPIPDPQELWNDKCALFEATTFVFICYTAITNIWKSNKQCHFGRIRIDWKVERGKHGSQEGPSRLWKWVISGYTRRFMNESSRQTRRDLGKALELFVHLTKQEGKVV